MRSAHVHGGLVLLCMLVIGTVAHAQPPIGGAQHKVPLRETPIEAYGVLCAETPGEVRHAADGETREITYTGIVTSAEPRVAGALTVWLTVKRDARTGGASYIGRMEVRPAGLTGDAAWVGRFSGDLERSQPKEDAAALGRQIVHRRMISTGHGRTGEVRRLLHGTGAFEGSELIFDFRLNEGTRPPKVPERCQGDFELWKGAIVTHREHGAGTTPP